MHSEEAISNLVDSINISDFANISWKGRPPPGEPTRCIPALAKAQMLAISAAPPGWELCRFQALP
jgi:hypothetical protein